MLKTEEVYVSSFLNIVSNNQFLLMHYRLILVLVLMHQLTIRAAHLVFFSWPRCEKTCLRGVANNTGANHPAHSRSLISAFVIRVLDSTISKLATSEISFF